MIIKQQWLSPKGFYQNTGYLLPWCAAFTLIGLIVGMYTGLITVPADYKQGEAFRIIYIHVPAAILSMGIYTFMAICAAVYVIWQIKLAGLLLEASIPLGALFTFIALTTGSIWGKPMWGTWWIWDARLTSELILLFLYLSVFVLSKSIKNYELSLKAISVFVLVGFIDIPIIHYSVKWWATLHQGSSFTLFSKPKVDASMLYPIYFMFFSFISFFLWMILSRCRDEILFKEKQTKWVQKLLTT